MGKNTSVILGEYYEDLIKKEMRIGTYASASEMIREGLRLLDERKQKIQAINNALDAGEKSGEPLSYDHNAFLKKMATKHKQNV
jgi:antitoxin ParD1/3/4